MRRILPFLMTLFASAPAMAERVPLSVVSRAGETVGTATLDLPSRKPRALILLMHGSSQTGASFEQVTNGQWHALAEAHDLALLWADGLDTLWNIGVGPAPARLRRKRDDIAYLQNIIGQAQWRTGLSAKQTFAVGFSMGGQMGFALACAAPTTVAGVASVAHPLPNALAPACPPLPGGFPMVLIHGPNDPLVPYEGGVIPSGIDAGLDLMSHEETADHFAARGAEITALTHEGGHVWPGGTRDYPALYLGALAPEMNAARAILTGFGLLD